MSEQEVSMAVIRFTALDGDEADDRRAALLAAARLTTREQAELDTLMTRAVLRMRRTHEAMRAARALVAGVDA